MSEVDEKGIVTKTVLLNDLLQKLKSDYLKKAIEKPDEIVSIIEDIIEDVERAIRFKEKNVRNPKANQNGIDSSEDD